MGCALYIPQLNIAYTYKLNSMTSSHMAEAFVVDKVMDLII